MFHGGQVQHVSCTQKPGCGECFAVHAQSRHAAIGKDAQSHVCEAFLARVPPDVQWRPNAAEVTDVLTPAVEDLWDPEIRRELRFTSARFPEGLLVDGIPVGDRVLWGMTLRLLDDVVPRLLAGEWEQELR